ncbi:MAG TPA: hypothetical protein VMB51_08150 [Solirubrobacteraceae bacterium]|nr:hypothetical protein [Solirubrobacteraceae bacterium]
MAACYSSHTQVRSRARRMGTRAGATALREQLIEAAAEVLAAGGGPRLGQSLA